MFIRRLKFSSLRLFLWTSLLLIIQGIDAFRNFARSCDIRSISNRTVRLQKHYQKGSLHILDGQSGELDRELDKFFELAAGSGSDTIRKMTPLERAERAIRGGEIEDEIFDLRGELMKLEDDIFAGKDGVDVNQVKILRQKMDDLKDEYRKVVGATDTPIYFGRNADSLQ